MNERVFHDRKAPGEGAPIAVTVDHVTKMFRLYHERNDSLKVTVMRRGRAKYEEFLAVNDVSFEIRKGETFGIIGENGSGKSTLLKTMARIFRPDRGTVSVTGKLSALLELGAGFHPELSGRENVYLNGSVLGLSKRDIDRLFDDIVAFAELADHIDTPVKNYSSGMYVRLGFSVAINVDPEVLLIDEVLAVGDESFQRRCIAKFAEMQQAGKTVVLVSHALASVRAMCDRAAWLHKGRLIAVGPTSEVIDQYLASVHVDEIVQGDRSKGTRWGNGEAMIEGIELLRGGPAGPSVTRVATGSTATIRLHYRVTGRPIHKPVVGFAIHRIDGVHITGVNCRESGLSPDEIAGTGYFDYVIDRMPLLPGTYDLSVALQDYQNVVTYDWWQDGFRFEVDPGWVRESEGLLSFLGHWEHPAAGAVGPSKLF